MLLSLGLYVHSFDEQLWKTPIWKSSINNSLCDFRCAATPQCMPWPCHFSIPAPRHSASQTGQRMERVSTSREVQFKFIVAVNQLPSTSIRTTRAIPGVYRRQPQVVDQTDQTFSLRRTVWPQKSGALGADLGAPGPVGSYDFSTDVLTTYNKYNM